jgi:outer membrane protein
MIKRVLLGATFLLCTLSISQAQLKVAVVDLNKVFNDFYKTKQVDAELKEQVNKFRKERDDQMNSYKTLVDQIKGLEDKRRDPAASEAVKKDTEAKLKDKVQEAQNREQEMRNWEATTGRLMQDQMQRNRKRILDEITAELDKVSKSAGYDLVLDRSGLTMNGTSAFAFINDKLPDISDSLLKTLNASEKK